MIRKKIILPVDTMKVGDKKKPFPPLMNSRTTNQKICVNMFTGQMNIFTRVGIRFPNLEIICYRKLSIGTD